MDFVSFTSHIDISFLHKLYDYKLNVIKLNNNVQYITGYYTNNKNIPIFNIGDYSLSSSSINNNEIIKDNNNTNKPKLHVELPGVMIILNTYDEFKNFNRVKWLEENKLLDNFLLLIYGDLKNMNFVYWLCFPNTNIKINIIKSNNIEIILYDYLNDIKLKLKLLNENLIHPYFGIIIKDKVLTILNFDNLCSIIKSKNYDEYYLGFVDPSSNDKLGWPAINGIRSLIKNVGYIIGDTVNLFCYRDLTTMVDASWRSLIVTLKVDMEIFNQNRAIGWELNAKNQFGPKRINMKDFMDPNSLINSALNLNLSLLKWRLVPTLNLDTYYNSKVLLIGMGTLGCSVARTLIAWGFKSFTLIDNGNVSWSNPVRQSLFSPKQVDKSKVDAAKESILEIVPFANVETVNFTIPMPGHPTSGSEKEFNVLHNAIKNADVVFVLTDSRESRWLPGMLAHSENKLCIHVALAWDGYLVTRQGVNGQSPKLGCYFCSDVMAPSDSLSNRTLDQQCTVTRPGLAALASSLAVEIMASVLQHPFRELVGTEDTSCLGKCPHTLRGGLSSFDSLNLAFNAFDRCTCCSDSINDEFKKSGYLFIQKAIDDPNYLEEVSGIKELKARIDDNDVNWDDDEEVF